jgi:uncharacterized Rmd1/YagE family protein
MIARRFLTALRGQQPVSAAGSKNILKSVRNSISTQPTPLSMLGKSTKPSLRRAVSALENTASKRRGEDRRPSSELQPQQMMTCFAYCTAKQYDLNKLASSLPTDRYQVITSGNSSKAGNNFIYSRLIAPSAPNADSLSPQEGIPMAKDSVGGGEIFFFRDGCTVTWNTTSEQDSEVLRYAQQAEIGGFEKELIDIEEMQYTLDPER